MLVIATNKQHVYFMPRNHVSGTAILRSESRLVAEAFDEWCILKPSRQCRLCIQDDVWYDRSNAVGIMWRELFKASRPDVPFPRLTKRAIVEHPRILRCLSFPANLLVDIQHVAKLAAIPRQNLDVRAG